MTRIIKLKPVEGKEHLTPTDVEHIPGTITRGKNLPVDYTVEGTLDEPIVVGSPILMSRETRNGVSAPGLFRTSPVVKIEGSPLPGNIYTAHTENSVYYVDEAG